jgi:DNA-directed RNA polymerase II subunit RPB1
LKSDPTADSYEQAIMMKREIQQTTVRDITKSVRMYYDPFPLTTDSVVADDREILQTYQRFSTGKTECASKWVMRLEFDDTELAARNIQDMVLVQDKLGAAGLHILQCVYSDSNSEKLVMRIVFPEDAVKNLLTLRFLEERVLDVVISGVEGVGRVFVREVNKEMIWDDTVNGYISKKQHVLDVEGANLFELLGHESVDTTRSFSNHIYEVLDVFGIEAARQATCNEFAEQFEEAYVNYHHMSVLLDSMTYQGRLLSVNRFGMGKHDNGVLAKSSFEETSKILFNAAVAAEFDPMKGVSANIMFGQKPPCGTGFVDILLDETRLPEGNEEEAFVDYREQIKSRVEKANAEPEGECKIDDISMW